MSLQKLLWMIVGVCVVAGAAWADPVRTVFVRENKFPGAMGWEVGLEGGVSSFDAAMANDDMDWWSIGPAVRFGATDRVALRANLPYVGYSAGNVDEKGFGDMELGLDFLFFEDIFEYAWIVPHATAILATGDEDKGLGSGDTQGRFGISIGTTVNDILHFGADLSYTSNGTLDDMRDEREDLTTGAVSLVVDLDQQASVLGEIQFSDDPVDNDDSYGIRYHLGLVYRINRNFSLMAYGGAASGLDEDYYGKGRLVYQF